MSEFLAPKDVATMLSVSHTTASAVMRRAGAINIGGGERKQRLRITESCLLEYLKSRVSQSKKPLPPQSAVAQKKRKPKKTGAKTEAPEGRKLPWNG